MKKPVLGLFALIAAILFLSEALSPATPAQAVPPITVIAFSGVPLPMMSTPPEDFGPPDSHDTGQVAFVAQEGGGGVCNLYVGDGTGSPLERALDGSTVIPPGGGPPAGTLDLCSDMHERPPVLNVAGDVVFQGSAFPGLRAIYLQPGGAPSSTPPLTLVQDGDSTPLGGTFGRPTLIDQATECDNSIDDDPGDDSPTPTVNDGCTAVGPGSPNNAEDNALNPCGAGSTSDCGTAAACTNAIDDDGDGAVNDGCPTVGTFAEGAGQVLFHAPVNGVGGVSEGYFIGSGPGWLVPWTKVVDDSDSISAFAGGGDITALGGAAMNDEGDVVWAATTSGGDAEEGIYLGSTPTATLVVDANDPEEDGECSDDPAVDDDGDGLYNEGCPPVVFLGEDCTNSTDDDGDGKVNDGCPTVGSNPESGSQCNNALNDDPIDDGGTPRVNDGCPSFDAEVNQCDDNVNADPADDAKVNDGCAQVGATAESGAECDNDVNDDSSDDAVVNDGCATVGTAETNQCDNTIDDDGDGTYNDGCPTQAAAWSIPPSYSDPYTTVSEPRINDDDEVTFRATTANGYTGYFGGPASSPIGSPQKLVILDDPWYGGDSFKTLSGGGPCDNDENDDPADDSVVNDGCPQVGSTADSNCVDSVDDDGDGYVNDGCPTVGNYPENPYSSAESTTNSSNGSQLVLRGTSDGGGDIGVITFPHFQKAIKKGESGPGGGSFDNIERLSTSPTGYIGLKADVAGATCGGFEPNCKTVIKVKPDCLKDSDGDGLCDDWESNGIDVNNDGTIDLDLSTMGADPDKKDIFIEVDYMDCTAPADGAVGLPQGDPGQPCVVDAGAGHSHKPLGGIIEGGTAGPNNGVDSCNDGVNNDAEDGTDTADPDCSVVKAFEDSPAYNPTDAEGAGTCNDGLDNDGDNLPDQFDPGCQGITLHVYIDEALGHADYLDFPTPAGAVAAACNPGSGGSVINGTPVSSFNPVKAKYFGTVAERGHANANRILTAKFKVFRYSLFSHRQDPNDGGSSGCGELPGNDFYVSLGLWQDGVNDLDENEGTFMHELGHTLNLCHAGPAAMAGPDGQCHASGDVNYKPNYLSIMNYTFQMNEIATDPGNPQATTGRPLDYSRWALPSEEDGAGPGTCDDGIDNGADWVAATHDVGIDGSDGSRDFGEGNGIADPGEPNVDRGDPDCYLREPNLAEPVGIDGGIADVTSEDGAGPGTCSDGLENGVDGVRDAADPDCAINGLQARTTAYTQFPFESIAGTNTNEDGAGPGTCYDGIDNGGGGDGIDLFDTDCRNCNDGIDNEAPPDGKTDTLPGFEDEQCICAFVTTAADGPKDWNSSNATDAFNVIAPIKDPPQANHGQCWGNTPGQTLKGYNDWLNLRYTFRGSQGYSDGVDRGVLPPDGDATPVIDTDGDGLNDLLDTDDDNDLSPDTAEIACGSDPRDVNSAPERLGNGVDDDGNGGIDELQAVVAGVDCDGDGYDDDDEALYQYPAADGPAEAGAACDNNADDDGDGKRNDGCEPTGIDGRSGTDWQQRCAAAVSFNDDDDQDPADFNDDGLVTILDVSSFAFPAPSVWDNYPFPDGDGVTLPGDSWYNARWDLSDPGLAINILDISTINRPKAYLGGVRPGDVGLSLACTPD